MSSSLSLVGVVFSVVFSGFERFSERPAERWPVTFAAS